MQYAPLRNGVALPRGPVEITSDHAAVAEGLAASLSAAGYTPSIVRTPTGAPLIVTPAPGDSTQAHVAALEQLKALKQVNPAPVAILLQDRTSVDGAWQAGLTGLAKTAQKEWPEASISCLDVPLGDVPKAATRITTALSSGQLTAETLLTGENAALTPQLTGFAHAPHAPAVGPQSVFLVTGGARGVTADCVIALARRTGARFALLGRSQQVPWPNDLLPTTDRAALRGALIARAKAAGMKVSPKEIDREAGALLAGREIDATLTAIAKAGGQALYLAADVSDASALANALHTAEHQLGGITGLIHGAGVLADKRIEDKTPDQVARVFGPKVNGLRAILNALSAHGLSHIGLFSSVAARFGNPGQADYSMANEVLNRVAEAERTRRPEANIVSLNWGPWDGGMVDEGLKAHFAAQGVALIDRQAGAEAFARLMIDGSVTPEVVIGGGLPHG